MAPEHKLDLARGMAAKLDSLSSEEIDEAIQMLEGIGDLGQPNLNHEATLLLNALIEARDARPAKAQIPVPKTAHVDTEAPPPKSEHHTRTKSEPPLSEHHERSAKSKRSK
jgi:hypothetical protein